MAKKKKPGDLIVPPNSGVFGDLLMKIKLILRLMGDSRVNIFLKILPLAGLAYWIIPLPLDNMIPVVDDAAIVWLGSYLFIELCPPDVVNEHMEQLTSNLDIAENYDEVVDAESVEDISDE
jgi:hypothetical protein